MSIRFSESKSTRPPMMMRPPSGVVSPARQLSSVVLPEPDAPKRIVIPGGAVKSHSSVNSPSDLRMATESNPSEPASLSVKFVTLVAMEKTHSSFDRRY